VLAESAWGSGLSPILLTDLSCGLTPHLPESCVDCLIFNPAVSHLLFEIKIVQSFDRGRSQPEIHAEHWLRGARKRSSRPIQRGQARRLINVAPELQSKPDIREQAPIQLQASPKASIYYE
jgi:hypothetical protein